MHDELWLNIVGIAIVVLVFTLVAVAGYRVGYHDGQIDALSGKPRYELRANERGETVWMEVTK